MGDPDAPVRIFAVSGRIYALLGLHAYVPLVGPALLSMYMNLYLLRHV